jgi:hypothetical protein
MIKLCTVYQEYVRSYWVMLRKAGGT